PGRTRARTSVLPAAACVLQTAAPRRTLTVGTDPGADSTPAPTFIEPTTTTSLDRAEISPARAGRRTKRSARRFLAQSSRPGRIGTVPRNFAGASARALIRQASAHR